MDKVEVILSNNPVELEKKINTVLNRLSKTGEIININNYADNGMHLCIIWYKQ